MSAAESRRFLLRMLRAAPSTAALGWGLLALLIVATLVLLGAGRYSVDAKLAASRNGS